MTVETEFRQLKKEFENEFGSFVESHDQKKSLDDFEAEYKGRPVAFAREVLGVDLTSKQEEVLVSIVTNACTWVAGANAVGKDTVSAVAALYVVYCERGLVLASGPTDRQVREQFMRREVRRIWSQQKSLPGELFEMALRIAGHERTGILAFTATGADQFVGHHAPRIMVILGEGQGVADDIYDAAFKCTIGGRGSILVVGNTVRPIGRFYECSYKTNWHKITIDAFSHPNVIDGREIIPGAITREGVQQIEDEFGKDSPQYLAGVLAQFPSEAAEQLIRAEWIDRAVELWHERGDRWFGEIGYGIDVAYQGKDSSAGALYQNDAIREVKSWRGLDAVDTAQKVMNDAKDQGATRQSAIVDVIGLGHGTYAFLRRQPGWEVYQFSASWNARDVRRFANARAEAAWLLREALESGRLPLPPNKELREELLAMTWSLDTQRRIQLPAKEEIKKVIKRSPDQADSVMMINWLKWPQREFETIPIDGFAAAIADLYQESAFDIG